MYPKYVSNEFDDGTNLCDDPRPMSLFSQYNLFLCTIGFVCVFFCEN